MKIRHQIHQSVKVESFSEKQQRGEDDRQEGEDGVGDHVALHQSSEARSAPYKIHQMGKARDSRSRQQEQALRSRQNADGEPRRSAEDSRDENIKEAEKGSIEVLEDDAVL